MKKKYMFSLPTGFRTTRIYRRWLDIKYWVLHRTTERYDRVDLKLPPGYYDPDTRIAHAVFSILEDFMEQESHIVDWEWTDDHSRAFLTMKRAYHWWKQFKNFDPWGDEIPGFVYRLPHYEVRSGYGHYEAAERWYNETMEYHLTELMKVRKMMWT